jgi:tetratricopeptide (TPR) repeat protein
VTNPHGSARTGGVRWAETPGCPVETCHREVLMNTLRIAPAVLLLAVGLAAAAPVPTVSDDQLKERAAKLNDITTDDARTAKLRELLKDRELAKRLVRVAAQMHDEAAAKEKPFKFNAALLLGQVAHTTKEYKSAKTFYTFCEEAATKLDSEPKLIQALGGLIDLAWDQKDFDGVLKACEKALTVEGDGREVQSLHSVAFEKMVQAVARKGETDAALAMVGRAPFKPWYANQLKSYIYREAGKYDEAVEALEDAGKALEDEEFPSDETKQYLVRRTKYMTANVHVENKKVDKAADILKGLMKDDPDNPTYPNDLGFIWCDNDMNLDESEKLIAKALELDAKQRKKLLEDKKIDEETAQKRTASYVDSMGWVLFKQKKYAEAKKYLEEAAADQDEAEHIEIWDHLADVQMALGDTKAAIDTWTKALKFDDLSKRDAERRKKVTQKLQKAKASLKDGEKREEKKEDKDK